MNKDYFVDKNDRRFNEVNTYDSILKQWELKIKTSDFSEVLSFFSNSVSGKQIKEAIEKKYIPIDFFNSVKKELPKNKKFEDSEKKLRKTIFG
jgi:hypothetical protein